MITKSEYQDLLSTKDRVELPAKTLIAKIKELKLNPTTKMDQLKLEYKTQLFNRLITVDKGIKLQYDLHKTEQAKIDLINKTISLDGYEEIVELETALSNYLAVVRNHFITRHQITPESFIVKHSGSLEEAFKHLVIDVTETADYKAFSEIAEKLNDLIKNGFMDENAFTNGFFILLENFVTPNNFTKSIEVNEEKLYYHLEQKAWRKKYNK